jgi:hypothetical protein
MFKYLILLGLVFLAACSQNKTNVEPEKKNTNTLKVNIFNPLYVTTLFDSPNNFGPIWNTDVILALKLKKVSLYVKGGRYKNNMSEKLTYSFNAAGKAIDFNHFLYNNSTSAYSNSGFTYDSKGFLEKIDVFRYMEFGNVPPILIRKDSAKTVVITSKNNNNFDSLVFYPTIENPKLIVEIVNHKVNSAEFLLEKGTSLEEIQTLAKTLDSTLNIFALSEKSVTYLENELPVESYRLGMNWNKQEKSKTWEYNENQQLIGFSERLHGTLIKNIVIYYDDDNLPTELVIDRKRFIFYSSTK